MSEPPFPPPRKPLSDGVVALREWREHDVPALVASLQDPAISRWMGVPSPYTESDAREFLAGSAAPERSFAIVDAETGELLGGIGLRPAGDGDGAGRIGYWAAAPARGRGVVPRALELLSAWALEELGLRRLEILTRVDNRASQRAAVKAGFRHEGRRPHALQRSGGPVDAVVLVRD